MRVRVEFRVNVETGEVEHFLVEDIGTGVEPDHDAVHDRIAHEVGRVVERRPAPQQVAPTGPATAEAQLTYAPEEYLPPAEEREEARE